VCHCATAGAAVAVVDAVAFGERRRRHHGRPDSWKGIKEEIEEGHRVLNPELCARKVTLLVAARAVDAHLLHEKSLPGRHLGSELVCQREVEDRALVDGVSLFYRHAALPEGARRIDLLAEVFHRRFLEQCELIHVELLLLAPLLGAMPLLIDDNWISFVKRQMAKPNAQDKKGAQSISPTTVCLSAREADGGAIVIEVRASARLRDCNRSTSDSRFRTCGSSLLLGTG
jgi:hypothetical protein